MQLIPIEKIFSNRDSIRKAREAFLILKGRTIDPNGLNRSFSRDVTANFAEAGRPEVSHAGGQPSGRLISK